MVAVVLLHGGGQNGYVGSGRESGPVPSAASSLGAAVHAAGVGTPEIRGRNGLKRVGLGRPGFRPFRVSGKRHRQRPVACLVPCKKCAPKAVISIRDQGASACESPYWMVGIDVQGGAGSLFQFTGHAEDADDADGGSRSLVLGPPRLQPHVGNMDGPVFAGRSEARSARRRVVAE